MNILVNLLPVYKGGGLQNAVNFWLACKKLSNNDKWMFIVRDSSDFVNFKEDDNHKIIPVKTIKNLFLRPLSDNIVIRKHHKKFQSDIILTLVGPGPIIKGVPKINGWHEPAYVYPESEFWKRASLKTRFLMRMKYFYSTIVLKKADAISVQTHTMAKRMHEIRNFPNDSLHVIPNGITSFKNSEYLSKDTRRKLHDNTEKIKLLLLSEPILHKNLPYLIDVAAGLSDKYVFIMSFNKEDNFITRKMATEIKNRGLESKFEFIGRVAHNEVAMVYKNTDAVFLPTLLESFSANYVEAMHYKLPIFTSELDFAKEICGDYAYYFDPFDANSGIKQLKYFFEKGGSAGFENKIKQNKLSYPDWDMRFNMYFELITEIIIDKE